MRVAGREIACRVHCLLIWLRGHLGPGTGGTCGRSGGCGSGGGMPQAPAEQLRPEVGGHATDDTQLHVVLVCAAAATQFTRDANDELDGSVERLLSNACRCRFEVGR